MGKDVKPKFKPRDVIVTERRADIRKAKDLLGFEPEIGLREGMREVAEDIKKHPEMY
jgi:UDP-glucose 4-epimerase